MANSSEVPSARILDDPLVHRLAPADDPDTQFFWTSGADGRLRIQRCTDCNYYVQPPTRHCPMCGSDQCSPQVVSGHGRVHTFTVNYQPWVKDQCPYIVAIVELDEQSGLRLTSNLLDCGVDDVAIGMRVTAGFVARHGIWYPVFIPWTAGAG
jgi:uncharacterized OB-fold protein